MMHLVIELVGKILIIAVVLGIETANRWSDREVLELWHKLLARLNVPQDNWLKLTTEFGKLFYGSVGTLHELTSYCDHLEKRRRHFSSCCQHLKTG
jgi:hypothetical protein